MTMSLDEKQSQITGTHESQDDLHNKRATLNRNETKHNARSEHEEQENEADGINEVYVYVYRLYSSVCTFRSCIGSRTQATNSKEHSQCRSSISLVVRLIHILNFCSDYFFPRRHFAFFFTISTSNIRFIVSNDFFSKIEHFCLHN